MGEESSWPQAQGPAERTQPSVHSLAHDFNSRKGHKATQAKGNGAQAVRSGGAPSSSQNPIRQV